MRSKAPIQQTLRHRGLVLCLVALWLVPIATTVHAQQGGIDASVVHVSDSRDSRLSNSVVAFGGGLHIDLSKRWTLGVELTVGQKRVGEQRSVLVSATTHLPATYVSQTTFRQSTFDVLAGPHWTMGPVSLAVVAGGGIESRQSGFLNYVESAAPPPADPATSSYTWLQTTFGAEFAWRIVPHISIVPKVRWQRTLSLGDGCCQGTQTHGHLAIRFVF